MTPLQKAYCRSFSCTLKQQQTQQGLSQNVVASWGFDLHSGNYRGSSRGEPSTKIFDNRSFPAIHGGTKGEIPTERVESRLLPVHFRWNLNVPRTLLCQPDPPFTITTLSLCLERDIRKLDQVDLNFVHAEGEGFEDLAGWVKQQRAYWSATAEPEMQAAGHEGWRITNETLVVCLWFRLIDRDADSLTSN